LKRAKVTNRKEMLMKTKTYSNNTTRDLFGTETYSEAWVIVMDSNNRDVQVTVDDLLEFKPTDNHRYELVYYDGQTWWISQDLHFPM
jgi:predicted lactoylglutathione lyase